MRLLGLILLLIGFLGAAFVSVRQSDNALGADGKPLHWQAIRWEYYGGFFVLGAVGVVLLRLTAKGAAAHEHKVDSDIRTLASRLTVITAKLRDLMDHREQVNVYFVHRWIDEQIAQDLADFVDARESMIPALGLQSYADVMNHFAFGERQINRAWCASADGYVDEVWTCLESARAEMATALELLTELQAQRPAQPAGAL